MYERVGEFYVDWTTPGVIHDQVWRRDRISCPHPNHQRNGSFMGCAVSLSLNEWIQGALRHESNVRGNRRGVGET